MQSERDTLRRRTRKYVEESSLHFLSSLFGGMSPRGRLRPIYGFIVNVSPLQVQIHTRWHLHFESIVSSWVENQAHTLFPVEVLLLQLRAP